MTLEGFRRMERGKCPCCDRDPRWSLMGFTDSGCSSFAASFSEQQWRNSASRDGVQLQSTPPITGSTKAWFLQWISALNICSSCKSSSAVCARVSGLVGTRRGGTLVMTENLCVRLSGGVHIGVPSTLRSEIDFAWACKAHHKPIFGVFCGVFGLGPVGVSRGVLFTW